MRIRLRIKRFNPEKDEKPWWGEYDVEVEPSDQLLDALDDQQARFHRLAPGVAEGGEGVVLHDRQLAAGADAHHPPFHRLADSHFLPLAVSPIHRFAVSPR